MPLTLTVYSPTTVLPVMYAWLCLWMLPYYLWIRYTTMWNWMPYSTPVLPTALFHRIARDYAVPLHLSP